MPYAARGGAGNIQAAQQQSERIAADLESGPQAAESYADPAPFRSEQQYAHTGRGGAGNYYSPRELNETGVYKDSAIDPAIGDGVNTLGGGTTALLPRKSAASESTRTYGRGGAGNYTFDASEQQAKALQEKLEQDQQKREKLNADIEMGVRESLAMPPKARLPGEKSS